MEQGEARFGEKQEPSEDTFVFSVISLLHTEPIRKPLQRTMGI